MAVHIFLSFQYLSTITRMFRICLQSPVCPLLPSVLCLSTIRHTVCPVSLHHHTSVQCLYCITVCRSSVYPPLTVCPVTLQYYRLSSVSPLLPVCQCLSTINRLSDPRIAELREMPRVSSLNCTAKLKSPAVWACLGVYPLDMPRTPYRASEGKRSQ